MHIVAINAGRKLSTASDWGALVAAVSEWGPMWSIIYVSECDAFRCKREAPGLRACHIWRHWPGHGSVAMAFIVRESWRGSVAHVEWHGRCGALDLVRSDGHDEHDHLRARIIGVHAPHDDEELEDTSSAIASLA